MKVPSSSLSVILFLLIPVISLAGVISFEDLAPRDSLGNATDGWGDVPTGYQGFNWSKDRTGDPLAGTPQWASLEGYMMMGGVGGNTYVHTREFSMANDAHTFDIASLTLGSYYYRGQDVYAQAWEKGSLKYSAVLTIDTTFHAVPVTLNYRDIDRFALWAGDGGALAGPIWSDHELCIDDISYSSHDRSSPIPEPSTLFIVGAGLSGLAWMYRRSRNESLNH
ncbi:MAG TPA: PEP-CTERM sorting domain-containing protein [Deltaproteobacteria bacterium]|jgi:hypothetical protein|nr:PEP-CTERM sorting domain-containing protein [Deltaproteobacteria bacterium]HQI01744.1 PEP-CTERM sorting domain-containing protein [Deltaproteobacteria bacterium]HQJ09866.1 PEP-CTERM sorting domain-containing protein [Deltaproteobacteria bacterium]